MWAPQCRKGSTSPYDSCDAHKGARPTHVHTWCCPIKAGSGTCSCKPQLQTLQQRDCRHRTHLPSAQQGWGILPQEVLPTTEEGMADTAIVERCLENTWQTSLPGTSAPKCRVVRHSAARVSVAQIDIWYVAHATQLLLKLFPSSFF